MESEGKKIRLKTVWSKKFEEGKDLGPTKKKPSETQADRTKVTESDMTFSQTIVCNEETGTCRKQLYVGTFGVWIPYITRDFP